MVREGDLSVAAIHRICKKAGAERVSESASLELARVLKEAGAKIARDASEYMMHTGRRTLKARDIEIAAKRYLRRDFVLSKGKAVTVRWVSLSRCGLNV